MEGGWENHVKKVPKTPLSFLASEGEAPARTTRSAKNVGDGQVLTHADWRSCAEDSPLVSLHYGMLLPSRCLDALESFCAIDRGKNGIKHARLQGDDDWMLRSLQFSSLFSSNERCIMVALSFFLAAAAVALNVRGQNSTANSSSVLQFGPINFAGYNNYVYRDNVTSAQVLLSE